MHLLSLIKTCKKQKNQASYLKYFALFMLSEHNA